MLSAHPHYCTFSNTLHVYRLGKRTKLGLLKDGYNSAYRYLLNNFYDGFKQVLKIELLTMLHMLFDMLGCALFS